MSRRKKTPAGTHVAYGLLKLKCPYGHELGAIVITRTSLRRLTRDQLTTFEDDETVDDPKAVTPGQPVSEMCLICQQQRGKYWYEQRWDVVQAFLDYELYDTTSPHRTLTLK